jgi:hypothetical protein
MMWMWDNYTTDPKERKEVYASFAGKRNQLGIVASIESKLHKMIF